MYDKGINLLNFSNSINKKNSFNNEKRKYCVFIGENHTKKRKNIFENNIKKNRKKNRKKKKNNENQFNSRINTAIDFQHRLIYNNIREFSNNVYKKRKINRNDINYIKNSNENIFNNIPTSKYLFFYFFIYLFLFLFLLYSFEGKFR